MVVRHRSRRVNTSHLDGDILSPKSYVVEIVGDLFDLSGVFVALSTQEELWDAFVSHGSEAHFSRESTMTFIRDLSVRSYIACMYSCCR